MNKYETTVIIDTVLDQKKTDEVIKKYEEVIKTDGTIIETEKWGKKRLAYAIQKKPTGYYVHFRYEAAGDIPAKMEKDFKLDASILRFMTVVTDKRALKQIAKDNAAIKKEEAEKKEA